jgi:hypothetical protein
LISKGFTEEAFDVIKKMRMSPQDPAHLVAKEEFYHTKEQLKPEAENRERRSPVGSDSSLAS